MKTVFSQELNSYPHITHFQRRTTKSGTPITSCGEAIKWENDNIKFIFINHNP